MAELGAGLSGSSGSIAQLSSSNILLFTKERKEGSIPPFHVSCTPDMSSCAFTYVSYSSFRVQAQLLLQEASYSRLPRPSPLSPWQLRLWCFSRWKEASRSPAGPGRKQHGVTRDRVLLQVWCAVSTLYTRGGELWKRVLRPSPQPGG